MEMKKQSRLQIIGLIGIGALGLAAFSQMMLQSSITRLHGGHSTFHQPG
jgi:hypothetical protein